MMCTVLVIDDDEDIRFLIETMLCRLGYNVVCARDGIEGIRRYREIEPGLVITDIYMPDQDGVGTIREIRAHNSNTKIIAMSGSPTIGEFDILKFASKLGADQLLRKPFEPEELRKAVSSCLMSR